MRIYSDRTFSRRLKNPSSMEHEEILGIVASLDRWKESLPKHGGGAGQDLPMLSPDRLLKGYYMVSEALMTLTKH
jgi:hypothetical protein